MMVNSQHLHVPEQVVLPPSPPGSVGSVGSAPELPPGEAPTSHGTEDVMITLPLPALRSASPRTRPPFFKAHVRSRSLAEMPTAPPMLRAHSSPGLDSRGRYVFVAGARGWSSSSNNHLTPHGTLRRQPSPHGFPSDDHIEGRLGALHISETISETAELDLEAMSIHNPPEHTSSSPILGPQAFPRISRRRPSSPLQSQSHVHAAGGSASPFTATSHHLPPHTLPVTPGSRYNESFPSYSASSASSMPSTPTSLRSRSPSISSLETIPDIPDAEAEAMEADRIAALKAAADRADAASEDAGHASRRQGTTDPASPSGGVNLRSTGLGGYGIRTDKRKRWSVCGAERRQDLDLETIWED